MKKERTCLPCGGKGYFDNRYNSGALYLRTHCSACDGTGRREYPALMRMTEDGYEYESEQK